MCMQHDRCKCYVIQITCGISDSVCVCLFAIAGYWMGEGVHEVPRG